MITYRFTVADLAAMRFAVSPLWEVVQSIGLLADPSAAAVHLPWLRHIAGRVDRTRLGPMVDLVPARGYRPDFLTPPPSSPLAAFDDEFATLGATPLDQVVHDMTVFAEQVSVSVAAPWLLDPARELARACATIREYWQLAVQPVWDRVRALLEADIAYRARRLTARGPHAVLSNLHRTVSWRDGALSVATHKDEDVELDGRGLLLVPSAFSVHRPAAISRYPWQPTVIYPARGVGLLWNRGDRPAADGLAHVLGPTRAALLTDLDAPRSTTELARRHGLSPPTVSEHLTALRGAALVTGTRVARQVLYVRTETGDSLIRAQH